jgi:hypothetical protein
VKRSVHGKPRLYGFCWVFCRKLKFASTKDGFETRRRELQFTAVTARGYVAAGFSLRTPGLKAAT